MRRRLPNRRPTPSIFSEYAKVQASQVWQRRQRLDLTLTSNDSRSPWSWSTLEMNDGWHGHNIAAQKWSGGAEEGVNGTSSEPAW